jgi:hypothetical protein
MTPPPEMLRGGLNSMERYGELNSNLWLIAANSLAGYTFGAMSDFFG